MKNWLWIGDSACGSGFGRATHHILNRASQVNHVISLGVNYRGDPHDEPYKIYPAWSGGDALGLGRLKDSPAGPGLLTLHNPDVVVVQTNPWHVPRYLKHIPEEIPVVGIIAVEGKNCIGSHLNGLKRTIFWTKFAQHEAELGGMEVPSGIVPLGVDLDVYKPGDRVEARQALGLPERCWDAFILGNVNRNQHRKGLDLSIQYFAEWYHAHGKPDAYLYLHVVPGSGIQCDCDQLADYYRIQDRLILSEPKDVFNGLKEQWVVTTMQAFDVAWTTTRAEGWGLTTQEMMACGIPQILPDYSALGEWAKDAGLMVPCSSEGLMPDVHTMIGGIPDKRRMIAALDRMYHSEDLRDRHRTLGLELVARPEYRWDNIAAAFCDEVDQVFQQPCPAEPN